MKVPKQKKNSGMDASIGVNLRVTAHSNQGGRKYMEDMFCVAYQPTSDEKDLLYAYFGIFDGHGGREAALYAKTHLMDHIVSQKNFWSDDDELVLRAIRDGFISVHQAMWRQLDNWPKTQSGLPSTSGTTASVAFVRRGKLYIGHVGDSAIVLGYQDPQSGYWKSRPLTRDHKPESPVENARIQESGGKVVIKSGVPRVVWNRPRIGHQGPVRRSTMIDEIPFLAVARSLGDLWSYNSEQNEFVVSPVPDTCVIEIDVNSHRCLILGSDGLWNMLSPQEAVNSVYFAERSNENEQQLAAAQGNTGPSAMKNWINPSKRLVDRALDRWYTNQLRADNTSVVTVVIDPPGPPRVQKNVSPAQQTHTGQRFSAVYTKYSANRGTTIVHSDSGSESSPSAAVPQQSRQLTKANQSKPSTSLSDSPAERSNRRKKLVPKVSSKTSRVLQRNPSNEESSSSSSNQSRISAVASPSASCSSQVATNPGNDSDVQINEISSSCESLKTESTGDANTSGKLRPVLPSTSGKPASTAVLKRSSRQSDAAEEETVSQRKIMKIGNEPSSSQRRSSPTAGKHGLAEVRSGRGLRSRNTNGTLTIPKKSLVTVKNARPTVATKVKNIKKVSQPASFTLPTLPRLTRGAVSDNSTENTRDPKKRLEDEQDLPSSKDTTTTEGKTNTVAKKPQPQRGTRAAKSTESQQSIQRVTRGKLQQGTSGNKWQRKTPLVTTPTVAKKRALAARKLLNTSLPSEFYQKTPTKPAIVSKPTLKRLKGSKMAFPRNKGGQLLRTRTLNVGQSGKRVMGKRGAASKSSPSGQASRGRVTRSMQQ